MQLRKSKLMTISALIAITIYSPLTFALPTVEQNTFNNEYASSAYQEAQIENLKESNFRETILLSNESSSQIAELSDRSEELKEEHFKSTFLN